MPVLPFVTPTPTHPTSPPPPRPPRPTPPPPPTSGPRGIDRSRRKDSFAPNESSVAALGAELWPFYFFKIAKGTFLQNKT